MKNILILVFITIYVLMGCSMPHNTLSEVENKDGWQLLFDGSSTNGWKMFNGSDTVVGWTVEDQSLVALGKGGDIGGDIVSERQFKNFELKWDWKIEPQGNSGVMYHVIEDEKFAAPYLTGPEYQMIDDLDFPQELAEWQLTGADYAMHIADPDKKVIKKAGEWNTSRIIFDNGHVEHWLNGVKIVEFEAWTDKWFELKNSGKWENAPEYGLAQKGHICLQDHGSKTWFRNIKIRELPDKPKSFNLFNGDNLNGWVEFGSEKWYVEEGAIIGENGPDKEYGYLATTRYFNDFDLSLEFKQVKDGNSGLFFRSLLEGTKITGWQVEIAPPGKDTGGVYESYGRGWLIQIPEEKEDALNYGEWNTLRIRLEGSKVTTWLNGKQMIELEDEKIGQAQGRIALQIHSDSDVKIMFRALKLQEL
ncbi:uncharacterized protein DUF1080 [Marinilabilia salmonicolor]|jgi:hypothetical protein|uniref:3-keto-disaccharide hydrolase n=1 Tax=Marinilabilia salmonicolor TaxID=989 RepID=UPI000D06743E|nr:DUF1080 domain-containing protein [Marinilabilia salmonicolor]PRY98778.1 uncharacterized protein DUF1080 [Marinilabilia salmonicolor]